MSSVAEDCLAQLGSALPVAGPPRVRRLHLPPEPAAGESRGEFCALELDDGTLGLSFVLLGDTLHRLRDPSVVDALADADAWVVARGFASSDPVARTLGLAAVNALTRWFFDRAGWAPDASGDSLGSIAPQSGDHLGMIGLFTPLLPRVLASGARLTVVELQARLAGDFPGYRVTLDARELEHCNKVLATGSLLLNDTLDTMLAHCRQSQAVALVGPTVGCLPDPLFARGVTTLGGTWILDSAAYLDALHTGQPRRSAARKSTVERGTYPGLQALRRRLA